MCVPPLTTLGLLAAFWHSRLILSDLGRTCSNAWEEVDKQGAQEEFLKKSVCKTIEEYIKVYFKNNLYSLSFYVYNLLVYHEVDILPERIAGDQICLPGSQYKQGK